MDTIEQRETKAILSMAEAINALTQQLSDANHQLRLAEGRVTQLEDILRQVNEVEIR